ncbi:hypothetical protein CERSUDRAFT_78581 [Gelatoporia subvermispora B]|uniref:Uncharacterized protein n=1 Tax=Ceriporiopsis subvermispora (strain B) TaxID=914234 RepID=M2QWF8_CERS8|nr:hypothetical protein CERSUDRAFT_78581 [Gelatoporia subvermispora B]
MYKTPALYHRALRSAEVVAGVRQAYEIRLLQSFTLRVRELCTPYLLSRLRIAMDIVESSRNIYAISKAPIYGTTLEPSNEGGSDAVHGLAHQPLMLGIVGEVAKTKFDYNTQDARPQVIISFYALRRVDEAAWMILHRDWHCAQSPDSRQLLHGKHTPGVNVGRNIDTTGGVFSEVYDGTTGHPLHVFQRLSHDLICNGDLVFIEGIFGPQAGLGLTEMEMHFEITRVTLLEPLLYRPE